MYWKTCLKRFTFIITALLCHFPLIVDAPPTMSCDSSITGAHWSISNTRDPRKGLRYDIFSYLVPNWSCIICVVLIVFIAFIRSLITLLLLIFHFSFKLHFYIDDNRYHYCLLINIMFFACHPYIRHARVTLNNPWSI